jgi:hypothetical protein
MSGAVVPGSIAKDGDDVQFYSPKAASRCTLREPRLTLSSDCAPWWYRALAAAIHVSDQP